MPGYLAALTLVLLAGMVVARVLLLKRIGISAMKFGQLDKTDFLIPPFALFYFYTVFAAAIGFPLLSRQEFFHIDLVSWLGVVFCLAGLLIFAWSLVSFGDSFRVGIDTQTPNRLVTGGVFAYTRNPIYVAFGLVLLGQFLVFPNWIPLLYLGGAAWLIHRQVLREEDYLKEHYGEEYRAYSRRVSRYL